MLNRRREEYRTKLEDPRWFVRRMEIRERDEETCQICFARHGEMEVHHIWYEWGREPWDYPDEALVTLCRGCHDAVTRCPEKNELLKCRDVFPFSFWRDRVARRRASVASDPDIDPDVARYLLEGSRYRRGWNEDDYEDSFDGQD